MTGCRTTYNMSTYLGKVSQNATLMIKAIHMKMKSLIKIGEDTGNKFSQFSFLSTFI